MRFTGSAILITVASLTFGCSSADDSSESSAAVDATDTITTVANDASTSPIDPNIETISLTFEVTPMHCDGCVSSIQTIVSGLDGVAACDVTLEDKRAIVTCDSKERIEEIVKALADDQREANLIEDA
ncbi:MAG: heavy metal-associated domain-containing protein [Planctomycetota bacterium]